MKAFNLGKYSVDIEELVAPMSNSNYFTFLICDRNIQKQKKYLHRQDGISKSFCQFQMYNANSTDLIEY